MGTARSMATLITLYEYGYAYAHFYYFFLSQCRKSTLTLRYMSMATPRLCSSLLIIDYYMGTASLDLSSIYEYGDTFAHLDAILYGYGKSMLIVSL